MPYIDFCFPQPPLNAYFNAALFSVFGTSWRVTHIFASLFLAATAYLAADFVLLRFSLGRWRWPCALLTALFIGLNEVLVQFGPIAQAYAISMLFCMLAFRLTVIGVRRMSLLFPAAAGCAAGAAAASTLLTAPVLPVLFGWMVFYDQAAVRWKKAAAFAVGATVPFFPVLLLFLKGPRQTFFNVVQYQASVPARELGRRELPRLRRIHRLDRFRPNFSTGVPLPFRPLLCPEKRAGGTATAKLSSISWRGLPQR